MSDARDTTLQGSLTETQSPAAPRLSRVSLLALSALTVGLLAACGAKSDAGDDQAVALRIQPVAGVRLKTASAGGAPKTGEQVYQAVCSACHANGTLGAPKFGDAAAWGPRLGQGYDALLNSALKGKNSMPAQGGGDTSDLEIGRAVVYMANNGGGKLAEPAAPAAQ